MHTPFESTRQSLQQNPTTWLVTGAAGFIGFHVAKHLLEQGHTVTGIDNLNHYYDPALKRARLDQIEPFERFTFRRLDIADEADINGLFEAHAFDCVIHLAAQAGVRYCIDYPQTYVQSNLVGFANIL